MAKACLKNSGKIQNFWFRTEIYAVSFQGCLFIAPIKQMPRYLEIGAAGGSRPGSPLDHSPSIS